MSIRLKRWLRLGLWLLVALWMAQIFRLSAQTADVSSVTSGRVIRWLLERFDSRFADLPQGEQLLRMEELSFAVRKLAHLCLFAVLGFLAYAAFSVDLPPRRAFPAALILGGVRGVLDEVHQAFVPGRSCELRDMGIDFAGVLLGAALLWLAVRIVRRRKKRIV